MNLLTSMLAISSVYLGGDNIGFSLKPNGVIISGTYDVICDNHIYNPKNFDIRPGDIIISIDNQPVDSVELLNQYISSSSDLNVDLTLIREEKELSRELKLNKVDGSYKTGLFVKPSTMGIGTSTFYTMDNQFAGLGHPVKELNTTVPIIEGNVYYSSVNGIKKAEEGKVGEKVASLDVNNKLGSIYRNTEFGISGYYTSIPSNATLIDVADFSEIKTGPAKMLTVINGNKKEYFDINITSISNMDTNNGLKVEITDPRLIKLSGGIVAGMSGSPIVQNNKLVGAITHVIVSNPTKGYGVSIDKMINHLFIER